MTAKKKKKNNNECALHSCTNRRKPGCTLCASCKGENIWVKTGPGVWEGFHFYILVNGVFYPRTWNSQNLEVLPLAIKERANVARELLFKKKLPLEIIEMIFSMIPYHPS